MARYPFSSYGRRRSLTRNRIYIISASLIIAAVIAFICGSYLGKGETPALPSGAYAEKGTIPPAVVPAELGPEPNLSTIAPKPAAESDPKAQQLIDEAMALIKANPGRIINARDILNEVLIMPASKQQLSVVKKRLSNLADKWLFSRSIFSQDRLCSTYRVKPGEQLRTIGAQFKVPYEILMQINNITRPKTLRAGETIKVMHGPFHARVYRSTFTMDLYLQNTFIRSFRVGLGKPSMETPTGLWLVKPGGKLIKPVWTDPITNKTYHPTDPDYPLGSGWIGLEGIEGEGKDRTGFAIHGWKDHDLMAGGGSQGCIRLHDPDVILIYKLLMPGFSRVHVVE